MTVYSSHREKYSHLRAAVTAVSDIVTSVTVVKRQQ